MPEVLRPWQLSPPYPGPPQVRIELWFFSSEGQCSTIVPPRFKLHQVSRSYKALFGRSTSPCWRSGVFLYWVEGPRFDSRLRWSRTLAQTAAQNFTETFMDPRHELVVYILCVRYHWQPVGCFAVLNARHDRRRHVAYHKWDPCLRFNCQCGNNTFHSQLFEMCHVSIS